MPKPIDKTFLKSIRPDVRLDSDETCSHKRHFRNVLREVVGYIDKLAGNDPERFVWASIPDITRHCNKFLKEHDKEKRKRDPYKQRQVEYAITYLRELRIISKPVQRERMGLPRTGYIVAPHDGNFVRTGSTCRFKQFATGRWQSSGPGGAIWWTKSAGESAGQTAGSSAAQSAVSTAGRSAVSSAVSTAVSNEKNCGTQCGEQCGTDSPQPYDNDSVAAIQYGKPAESPKESDFLTGVAGQPVKSGQPFKPGQSGEAGVSAPARASHDASSQIQEGPKGTGEGPARKPENLSDLLLKTNRQTEKEGTIGFHFKAVTFRVLTDGECDENTLRDYPHRGDLIACARAAVARKSAEEFRGRESCAEIMGDAMQRLRDYNHDAPTQWVKVMKKLRRVPGAAAYESPERTREEIKQHTEAMQKLESKNLRDERPNGTSWADEWWDTWSKESGIELVGAELDEWKGLPRWVAGTSQKTHADGYKYLAAKDNLPESVARLRDWLKSQ